MALDVHRQEERGIKVAYLLDADLMGNRWHQKFETLVTDLEYHNDIALLADNWADLTTMLDSLATTCKKLAITICFKKTKTLAVLTYPGAHSLAPIQLVPGGDPIKWYPTFSIWAALSRITVGWMLRSLFPSTPFPSFSSPFSLLCS